MSEIVALFCMGNTQVQPNPVLLLKLIFQEANPFWQSFAPLGSNNQNH